jgi:hypothetical protein
VGEETALSPSEVYLEGWSPAYGSAYAIDEDEEPQAEVVLEEDGGDLAFHLCAAIHPEVRVAFVDGVRRKEEGLYRSADDGRVLRALVGAYAVGSVLCDGIAVPQFGGMVVRRLAIWCGGEVVDIPAARGGYAWDSFSVAGTDPLEALRDLQNRMRDDEGRTAEELAAAGWTVIVDGPLSHVQNRDFSVIGYVKVQHRMHLSAADHARLPELKVGERCSIFRYGERRYSCYTRIEARRPMTGPWHAIVRLEFPQSRGLAAAVAAADFAAGLLPKYTSRPWRDPRAPQNLAPVGSLETRLRHQLGDQALAARAVREAVATLAARTRIPA